MTVLCVRDSNLNISVMNTYSVLDNDSVSEKYKIFDNNGHVIWVCYSFFRMD
jgi:hypothetical protein